MNGWLRLHRQLLQWEWYSCINTTRVFIHLLLTASWRDARWQGIEIPRGSLFASPETLATATGLTRQQVRTVIARLKSTNEITTKATNRGTLITLCNFDTYNPEGEFINQPDNQPDNKTLTSDQPAINQRLTTSEEGKEGKRSKRAVLEIPSDLPSQCQEALSDWIQHRAEIKKPITHTQWARLISDFRKNPEAMRSAVNQSILSGWRGLFPDKNPVVTQPASTPKPQGPPANWREIAARVLDRPIDGLEYHNLKHGEQLAIADAIRNA